MVGKHLDIKSAIQLMLDEIEAYNQLKNNFVYNHEDFVIMMHFCYEVSRFRSYVQDEYITREHKRGNYNAVANFSAICPVERIRAPKVNV